MLFPFIHSFIQEVFIKGLPCERHQPKDTARKKTDMEVIYLLRRKINNEQVNISF